MSVMVGVTHNGRVALAADSQWVSGWDRSDITQPKVVRRRGLLVTVGPACGYEQVLWDEVEALSSRHEDWPTRWAAHCLGAPKTGALYRLAEEDSSPILVVWRGRLLQLSPKGWIGQPVSGVDACGCGGEFALAAATVLLEVHPEWPATKLARTAARVACSLSAGCAAPIIVKSVPSEVAE